MNWDIRGVWRVGEAIKTSCNGRKGRRTGILIKRRMCERDSPVHQGGITMSRSCSVK